MLKWNVLALCAISISLAGCTGKTGHKSNEKYYLISANIKAAILANGRFRTL